MKNAIKNSRLIVSLVALCAATFLGGCRQDVKYFLYYPHPISGAIQPSANWQEFNISPLKIDEKEYLVITFNQDGRTLCQNDISAHHLCSPTAQAEKKSSAGKNSAHFPMICPSRRNSTG